MKYTIIKLFLLCIATVMSLNAFADDTEIFLGGNNTPPDPKVLFIFDNSGSMDAKDVPSDTGSLYRTTAAKRALLNIIFAPENANLDFGLMAFNKNSVSNNDGGRIIFKLQNIDDTNRGTLPIVNNDNVGSCATTPPANTLSRAVCDLRTDTWTPLAETMYEAYRYFHGDTVQYGNENPNNIQPAKDTNAEVSGTYISPLYDLALQKDRDGSGTVTVDDISCEQAYIVLLTDGEPSRDTDADAAIDALLSAANITSNGGSLLDDLAEYLFTQDMDGNASNDIQRVVTYTVGLKTEQALLQSTAVRGGAGESGYFVATNVDQLTASFNALFAQINASSASYTSAGTSASVANDTRSLKYVYYSYFTPNDKARWDGNLKKYRLGDDPNDGVDELKVLDNNIKPVFNDNGEITSLANGDTYDVQSVWSSTYDAGVVNQGGAGSSITDYTSRTIYINLDTDNNGVDDATLQPFTTTNANITNAIMGVATDAEKDALIHWARGQDPDNTTATRWVMGDPLHSAPVIVNYGKRNGSTAYAGDYSDVRILVGTNAGFLHMFKDDLGGTSNACTETKDGDLCPGFTKNDEVSETWAFIPRELTHIIAELKSNSAVNSHPYGVDGTVAIYKDDKNNDGNICTTVDCDNDGNADNDKVIGVFGLRRGVDVNGVGYYYALDISNPDSPVFLWKFSHSIIEQTWSKPQFGKVKYHDGTNIVIKNVAVFAAGYDSDKDVKDAIGTDDDKGRGVFIVDVETGEIIWTVQGSFTAYCSDSAYTDETSCVAANATWNAPVSSVTTLYETGLKDSMPASPTVVDIDGDTYLDRIYIPDTGGNVWRIDLFNQVLPTASSDSRLDWTIHKIAQLGRHESNTLENDRRFFNQIDFVQTRDSLGNFDALILGSGHRNNPNEQNVNNRLYMVKDFNLFTYKFADTCSTTVTQDPPPATCKVKPTVLGNADLADVSSQALSSASTNGWRLNLYATDANGVVDESSREKIMGSSVTIKGTVYINSYLPISTTNQCSPQNGTSYLYQIGLHSANGGGEGYLGGTDTTTNRKTALITGAGIPDTPSVVFSEKGIHIIPKDQVLSGSTSNKPEVFFWYGNDSSDFGNL